MSKEREKEILKVLLAKKQVSVQELSKMLYISESSVRRDLMRLEKQQLIRRVHGGAIVEESSISSLKIPFALRELEQSDAKIIIAKKAIEQINDYDVIFLDASSSAYALVPYLTAKSHLTVITSGIKTLLRLGEYGINAIGTGGKLLPSEQALIGEECHKTISAFNADSVFFSCRGLTEDGFMSDISAEEVYVRQHMIAHSKRSYLMCASEKIGKKYTHNMGSIKDISMVLSEKDLPY